MTNEKAIKVLNTFKDLNDQTQPSIVLDAVDTAINALESQRWIPVTERLPEESGCYLVVVADHEDEGKSIVLNAWFNTNVYNLPFGKCDLGWTLLYEFYDLTDGLREYITHWMPLPDLPKEEST